MPFRPITRGYFLLLISSDCLSPALAAEPEVRVVRLLTIGNSFSRNATNHFDDFAKANGHTLVHRPIVVGGASLELHATRAQMLETDPAAKEGLYTNGRSLRDELRSDQ